MAILNPCSYVTALTASTVTLHATERYPSSGLSLSQGDAVLLVVVNGHGMVTTDDATFGNPLTPPVIPPGSSFRAIVQAYDAGTRVVTLASPIAELANINLATTDVQLVKIATYTSSTTLGSVESAQKWTGPNGGYPRFGGVIAIEVTGDLTLSTGAVISASEQGFPGGLVSPNNTSPADTQQSGYTFLCDLGGNPKNSAHAGNKGMGLCRYQAIHGAGRGKALNAGGGGNSRRSGGGGGGNGGAGGKGGKSYDDYTLDIGGRGGLATGMPTSLLMGGGGGGGGTGGVGPDGKASNGGAGGQGGGIVYLKVSGTLTMPSNGVIRANGQQGGWGGQGNAPGGAGGGGAGGTIHIQAGSLAGGGRIEAKGGHGHAGSPGSPSGGGGGGVIRIVSGTAVPPQTLDVAGGIPGVGYLLGGGVIPQIAAEAGSVGVIQLGSLPVAMNQSVVLVEDTPCDITLVATNPNNGTLVYSVVTPPAHGQITQSTPGSALMTYSPAANYNGADSFTFRVNDGMFNSNVATVSLTITAVNDPPVASDLYVATKEDTAASFTLQAVDPDSTSLTYIITKAPENGTLSGTAPNLVYTPSANYFGSDMLQFKASDGVLESNIATVSFWVSAVLDPPIADNQTVYMQVAQSVDITLTATNPDNVGIVYNITTMPASGSPSGKAPNLTYTPKPSFDGQDQFTFTISNGIWSSMGTVTINVLSTDPPQ